MNFSRYRAAHIDRFYTRGKRRKLALLMSEAAEIRNRIAVANQRLVVSIARQFVGSTAPLDELVSAAQLPLLRAVELFDVSRGYCFSTYATHTIRNHCLRVRSRAMRQHNREQNINGSRLERTMDTSPPEQAAADRQSLIARFFAELIDREQMILSARFGLGDYSRPHTFLEIGRLLGLSKERTRVLAHRAIEKLQQLARRQNLTWLQM